MVGVGVVGVGVGDGECVVGVGDGDGECVVGVADGDALLLGDGFAEVFAAAGDVAGAIFAVGQVTEYACAADTVAPGLVTTSTTVPVCGTPAWNDSDFTGCVPALLKVSWAGVVFVPLDICQ